MLDRAGQEPAPGGLQRAAERRRRHRDARGRHVQRRHRRGDAFGGEQRSVRVAGVVGEVTADVLDLPSQQGPAFVEHVCLPLPRPGPAGVLAVDQETGPTDGGRVLEPHRG